jgi:hypothetical protein
MISIHQPITILKDLREHIIPLADEELFLLEKSIINEGCREPLIVWEKNEGQLILVDGHNRLKICQKNNISFKVKKIKLNNLEEAKIWMIDNQMGRRNLSPDQISYYRGLKYLSLKKKKGGYESVKSKGQSELSTSETVSRLFNVSESTIKRDAKYAEGLNIVGQTNPKLKTKILTGEAKVKKGDVQVLPYAKHSARLTIKNEADLYNKAKIIKRTILTEVEANLKQIGKKENDRTQDDLKTHEPAFLDKSDRLRKIKGMILSAMNRAINEKDVKAMWELKKLIERLEGELFE